MTHSPNVGGDIIRRHCERSFKTLQGHVVLRGIEAAQAQVLPDLGAVSPHLKETPVVPQRHFRLI